MEKIKINICGREYNLLSDDSPNRILNIAKSLELQIRETENKLRNRTEQEILTLVALNTLDECEKIVSKKDNKLKELENQIIFEKEKNTNAINENMKSAGSELAQIAAVKDEENELLHQKLIEYEKHFEVFVNEREVEIKKLKEGYDSAIKEMEHIAMVKETENAKLRNTLNSYESSFDLYVKLKEDEIIRLRTELENANSVIDELRQRLAALSDDGQLTIC